MVYLGLYAQNRPILNIWRKRSIGENRRKNVRSKHSMKSAINFHAQSIEKTGLFFIKWIFRLIFILNLRMFHIFFIRQHLINLNIYIKRLSSFRLSFFFEFLLARIYLRRLIFTFQMHMRTLTITNIVTKNMYKIIAAMVIRWKEKSFDLTRSIVELFDVSRYLLFVLLFLFGHVAWQSCWWNQS